jgi:hypothetical protein
LFLRYGYGLPVALPIAGPAVLRNRWRPVSADKGERAGLMAVNFLADEPA